MQQNSEALKDLMGSVYAAIENVKFENNGTLPDKGRWGNENVVVDFHRVGENGQYISFAAMDKDGNDVSGYLYVSEAEIITDPEAALYYRDSDKLEYVEDLLTGEQFEKFEETLSVLIDKVEMNPKGEKATYWLSIMDRMFKYAIYDCKLYLPNDTELREAL